MLEFTEKAIREFLLSKKGTSRETQEHYKRRLNIIRSYIKKKKIRFDKLNEHNIAEFLDSSYKKYKPKTMNHIKAVLKSFLRYHFNQDYYKRFPNLAQLCKSARVSPTYNSSQMLSEQDVQAIIQKENDYFWKLVYALDFYGGCRPNEVCKLKWSDVDITDEGIFFKIYSAKNNKFFTKFVPIEFSSYIKELKKTSNSEYVFVKQKGKPITRHSFYIRITRLQKKYFPNKKITPYILRHSIATILYGKAEDGKLNDDIVARQMGHSKSMKQIYANFDEDRLKEAAKKIYIEPEYTPEKRKSYEDRIKLLEIANEKLSQYIEKRDRQDADWKNVQKEIEDRVKNTMERVSLKMLAAEKKQLRKIKMSGKKKKAFRELVALAKEEEAFSKMLTPEVPKEVSL